MIDKRHLLTVGMDDATRGILEDFLSKADEKIDISQANHKAALKALMNILISLEENKNIRKGYDSLPTFFITHRLLYMAVFDFLATQGLAGDEIDRVFLEDRCEKVPDAQAFIGHCADTIKSVFSIMQPYLEADDDVDRFSRVIEDYAKFLKKNNDPTSMVRLVHQFATLNDKMYMAGYKKANDGWGGKLDLDQDVYPYFFQHIIREAISPYGYGDYVVEFLYDRLKEVGEAETVLIDLHMFSAKLQQDESLRDEIKAADEFLEKEIEKTVAMIEKQKGEPLSAAARSTVIRELTAYEALEGKIFYFFDHTRLAGIMKKTGNEALLQSTLDIIEDYTPKLKHYTMYAIGKLLQAPDSSNKMTDELMKMVCREVKLTLETINSEEAMNNLPAQYRQRVPDLEVRFLMNRMMTNTTSLNGFDGLQRQFREFLINQNEFPLIHEMYIERASEKRHASALMSFYILAWLVHDMGDVVPNNVIKVLAGRLALTYSFTRRINLFKEIEKLRYEFDGTHGDRETLYYNGFDKQNVPVPEKEKHTPLKDRPFEEQWIILYHFINNKELQQSLRLIDDAVLFDYVYAKQGHTDEDLRRERMELRGKVYKIIDDKFLDIVTNEEEQEKRKAEAEGRFPTAYYGKYEKIRSILVAQFMASGWDVEVYELRRKGKRPYIKMTQNELLRMIKGIDVQRVLEQYEYKEARENIDINTLSKQVETREQLLSFINRSVKDDARTVQKILSLSDEAVALLSYSSTKLRSAELQVEQGIKQLVDRLKVDLGLSGSREPLALGTILSNCMKGAYGKLDVKVIKKDKSGKPLIDPETGEEAEKTYTITGDGFPEYLRPALSEIEALDKKQLYRAFYLVTLQGIVAETFGSMTFIKEALAKNKYVVAADGLKEQALENHEVLEYARVKQEIANQLAMFEIPN